MGLLTNSSSLRKKLLSRNLYTPDNIYNINSGLIADTLELLASGGFDLRNSLLVRNLDNVTPLVRIGNEQLLKEITNRAKNSVGNIIEDKITNLLLGKDNQNNLDYRITPNLYGNPFSVENIANKILGVNTNKATFLGTAISNTDSENLGSIEFYRTLGSGQLNSLNNNLKENIYNRWSENSSKLQELKNNHLVSYYLNGGQGEEFNKRSNNAFEGQPSDFYGYIGKYDLNSDKIPDNLNNSDIANDPSNPNINSNLSSAGRIIDDILNQEGFGYIEKPVSNEDIYDDSNEFSWTSEKINDKNKFNIRRGLLYYTSQLYDKKRPDGYGFGNKIAQENKKFINDNGTVSYKGANECRSWTITESYGNMDSLIRYEGNNVTNSIIGKRVIPRIHPDGGNKQYMFSFENLAFRPEEVRNFKESEQGVFGGRIMWFPPYNLKISENVTVENTTEKIIGRIEPMYTYNGRERTATLSFSLLIDYPPQVDGYRNLSPEERRNSLIAFFNNCKKDLSNPIPPSLTNLPLTTDFVLDDLPLTDPSVTINVNNSIEEANDVVCYFENDIFEVKSDYSGATDCSNVNNYDLTNQINSLIEYTKKLEYDGVIYKFIGTASKLNDNENFYNTRLGAKRATRLYEYFRDEYISQTGLAFTELGNDIDPFAKALTAKTISDNFDSFDVNVTTVNNASVKIKIILGTLGSTQATDSSISASTISECGTVQSRNAKISLLYGNVELFNKNNEIKKDSIKTNTNTLQQNQINNALTNANNTIQNTNSQSNPLNTATDNRFEQNPMLGDVYGFDKMKYYAAVFHSQTPEDFLKRLIFLQQLTVPGSPNFDASPQNSVFGRMPVAIMRIGDFFHTKVVIDNISFDYQESNWDLNPEGLGVQPMIANITMNMKIIGGQSLASPIAQLQNALDINFYANSSFLKEKNEDFYRPEYEWFSAQTGSYGIKQ